MASIRYCALFLLIPFSAFAQSTSEQYIALEYAVLVNDIYFGFNNITPRYLWLDNHRLVVPVSEIVEEQGGQSLQNIDIFFIDLVSGVAVRGASFLGVFGITIVKTDSPQRLFLSPIVSYELNFGERGYDDYSLNTSSFELSPTTLEVFTEKRSLIQPYTSIPYPDTLLNISEKELYVESAYLARGNSGPLYPWCLWNGYYVGFGEEIDGRREYRINLYEEDGTTAFILPEIQVHDRHMLEWPESMQMSTDGAYLMIAEAVASAHTDRSLWLYNSKSYISVYGFVNNDPTGGFDTIVYDMSIDNLGEGYEIGEEFELERQIVDGSDLSTGRFLGLQEDEYIEPSDLFDSEEVLDFSTMSLAEILESPPVMVEVVATTIHNKYASFFTFFPDGSEESYYRSGGVEFEVKSKIYIESDVLEIIYGITVIGYEEEEVLKIQITKEQVVNAIQSAFEDGSEWGARVEVEAVLIS